MPIISVLNEKGGVGKTTISAHIARGLQKTGKTVLLVDGDPQGSIRDWHAAAGEDSDLPPLVAMDKVSQYAGLPALSKNYDFVIIDGAAKAADLSVAAVKVSQLVLIPVGPSPLDVWATESLVEIVKARIEIGAELDVAFILSRVKTGTILSRDTAKAIEEGYGLSLLDSHTTSLEIYPSSMTNGSTALDLEPESKAAYEIRAIVKELINWSK
jgi:chromosome partitioning protein